MDYFSIIDNILKKNINNYLYVENLYENFVKQEEKSKKIKKNQDIYSEYISEYIFLLHITTYHNSDYDIKIIKGTNNIVYIGLFEFDYEEVDSSNDEVEEQTENISYERTEDESIETNNSEYISSDEDENSETEDENINDDDSEYFPSEDESDQTEEDILISKISIIQLIKYIINTKNIELINLLLNYNDYNTNILHIIIENNMYNELDKIVTLNNLDLLNEKDLYNNYPIDYANDKSLRIILNKNILMNMDLHNNIETLNKEKNCLKNDVHLFYILINFGALMFSLYYLLFDDRYRYIKYMY
jgi:hypothetical protein